RMSYWPTRADYAAAMQNPQDCFVLPDLRQGSVNATPWGLESYTGTFALVFPLRLPGQRTRAVRCFLSPAPGRMMRYKAIHDHLALFALPFVVRFGYVEEGILVNGEWYPVVEMDWVEDGLTLNAFVGQHAGNPTILASLAERWLRLAQELRDAGVAHGDL